jgi:hypothetical protein
MQKNPLSPRYWQGMTPPILAEIRYWQRRADSILAGMKTRIDRKTIRVRYWQEIRSPILAETPLPLRYWRAILAGMRTRYWQSSKRDSILAKKQRSWKAGAFTSSPVKGK